MPASADPRPIPRLWYITDGQRGTAGRPLIQVIEQAAAGGVEAVVLRRVSDAAPAGAETSDAALRGLVARLAPLRAQGLRVLVSRRVDVALALADDPGIDGVHLARDALPIDRVRALLDATCGRRMWVGYSAHDAAEAVSAARAGADYVTLSPIFATDSKPGAPPRGLAWLAEATAVIPVPVIALGGVTPGRTRGILRAGAAGVAAVAALGATHDIAEAARDFRSQLLPAT